MKLSMLGSDYRYGFAPSASYSRANGRGYVSPLGADPSFSRSTNPSLYDAVNMWLDSYPNKWPSSTTQTSLLTLAELYKVTPAELYNAIMAEKSKERASALQSGLNTANSIIDALSKGVISVTEAVRAAKGLTGSERDAADDAIGKFQFEQYLPWIIGGGALIVGMFLIAGTRKRGGGSPRYIPGAGAYRY